MKTYDDVHAAYVTQAADDFLTRLSEKAAQGLKTPEQVQAFTCRLARALQLIEEHPDNILKMTEGAYQILSTGKNPTLTYAVGQTCTCPDADPQRGKAPGGWCKHRLAAYLLVVAEKRMRHLSERMDGPPLPHDHAHVCGHGATDGTCWDEDCTEYVVSLPCPECLPPVRVLPTRVEAAEAHIAHLLDALPEPQEPQPYSTEQYEEAPVLPPRTAAPCEALSSLNIEGRKGDKKVMWTLRSVLPGAAGDEDIIARLPRILGVMQKLGITFTTATE